MLTASISALIDANWARKGARQEGPCPKRSKTRPQEVKKTAKGLQGSTFGKPSPLNPQMDDKNCGNL